MRAALKFKHMFLDFIYRERPIFQKAARKNFSICIILKSISVFQEKMIFESINAPIFVKVICSSVL
jgi:hypothetical protein